MNDIGVIICYFGKWPEYFHLFMNSIIENKNIHWLIFSDNDDVFPKYPNIIFHKINKPEFNRLASIKTKLEIRIENPYKLCDLKPLYGKIFEDYLSNYKFWGYSDIDVIYGQISNFITDETLQNYDVISTYQGFLSGPFCLFRNSKKVNSLFEKVENYKDLIQDPKYLGFDENIYRKTELIPFSKKIIRLPEVLFFNLKFKNIKELSIRELKFQIQWLIKKQIASHENIKDMTDVAWYFHKKKEIKVSFKGLMISDRFYERIKKNQWSLIWENGKLIDQSTGRQLFGFHIIQGKNKSDFVLTHKSIQNNKFIITEQGIY